MKWLRKTKQAEPAAPVQKNRPSGIFSTDFPVESSNLFELARQRADLLARTFQHGMESLRIVQPDGAISETGATHAMDDAYQDLSTAKIINSTGGFMPLPQLAYFAQQGFIGWQTAAMLSQHWLIQKACAMPAMDAIRNGWEVDIGEDVDTKVVKAIKRADRRLKLKKNLRAYVTNGRVFGIRHCLFLVDGIDYEAPFNIDGVKPGSYRGMTQIDPYWIAPMLDADAAADPASMHFYEPTWWMVNGKRIHRSHFSIMINGDELPDILKPSYMYSGVSVPQKVYERVYASEKTANEAPQLAMSKRLTVLKTDGSKVIANLKKFTETMNTWMGWQNNFGVKVIDMESEGVEQYDTNLAGLDETVMTQYQLVAAAADVPATKLMGTSPKGFGASGEYESESYHEYLETLQEHDCMPMLEGHYLRLMKSEIMPKFGLSSPHVDVVFKPVDSPTAKEQAEINNLKADADVKLANAGAIDGTDIRQRIINDVDSGYTGIEDIVPGGPGDREAQQEAEAALEMPVNAKVTAKNEETAD